MVEDVKIYFINHGLALLLTFKLLSIMTFNGYFYVQQVQPNKILIKNIWLLIADELKKKKNAVLC